MINHIGCSIAGHAEQRPQRPQAATQPATATSSGPPTHEEALKCYFWIDSHLFMYFNFQPPFFFLPSLSLSLSCQRELSARAISGRWQLSRVERCKKKRKKRKEREVEAEVTAQASGGGPLRSLVGADSWLEAC